MTALGIVGIIALIVLGIILCFFTLVLGVLLGYYACYAKAYEEAENDHKELSESQKKLVEILKSQNNAYKKMFEESCEVEVEKNKDEEN